jgi:hypothetical protein
MVTHRRERAVHVYVKTHDGSESLLEFVGPNCCSESYNAAKSWLNGADVIHQQPDGWVFMIPLSAIVWIKITPVL